MRNLISTFFVIQFLSFSIYAQITNPVPASIKSSGITVGVSDWTTIRESSNQLPFTRINMLKGPHDGTGRLFVNDLRGFMWIIIDGNPTPFLSVKGRFENFIDNPGKGTGFGAFAFHPKFSENGIFYTSHAEKADSDTADFKVLVDDRSGFPMQWVLTEWTMDDPASDRFEGVSREVMRWEFPNLLHGVQDLAFNPTVEEGDVDFGNLYICIGDGGSSILFLEDNLQNTRSHLGTIFRIDPRGHNSSNGNYGIPVDNPYYQSSDSLTLAEIWCYGFRNPHRISWDPAGKHEMIIGDIGEMNIEELNLGKAGANYGWGVREGPFLYNRQAGREYVFDLPSDDSINHYVYPVAMYDHDEGSAIVGGFVYRGNRVPDLKDMYICGDIVSGRLFVVPADSLRQGRITLLEELHLEDSMGAPINLLQEVPGGRADLRFGVDQEGEIYILTKGDGIIRRFLSETITSLHSTNEVGQVFSVAPNPVTHGVNIDLSDQKLLGTDLMILSQDQKILFRERISSPSTYLNMQSWPAGIYYVRIGDENSGKTQPIIKN